MRLTAPLLTTEGLGGGCRKVFAVLTACLALATAAHAQSIVLHPRVFNDVPGSALTTSATATAVSISDQNVSAPTGFANRHDWRVSADGTTDRLFGATDYFDLSTTLVLNGNPALPRKEAGLRVNNAAGDGMLYVTTDTHDAAIYGALPFYRFSNVYNAGSPITLRIRYLKQGLLTGFIYTVNGVNSPFLAGSINAGSTIGGYLQVQNAPSVPDNGGSGDFTGIQLTDSGPISDAVLLDRTEAQACAYASSNIISSAGRMMIADTSRSGNTSSVAATGMGLVCLAIEAQRYGTTAEWTVTPADARAKADTILSTVLEMQTTPGANFAGVPYHFVVPGPSGAFVRAGTSEVSTIDGALLVAGALAAGQAFGGDTRTKALQIAANINWPAFLVNIGGATRFAMAWQPESGSGYSIPAGGGYLSSANWDRPTDEILLLGLVAVGNMPYNTSVLKTLYSWPRVARSYKGSNGVTYSVVNSYFGSLFTYTQAHALIPFDRLGKDHPEDVFAPVPPVDWWQNSVTAALSDRQYSADHSPGVAPPDSYPIHAAFGPDSWGNTAAFNPANLGDYKGLLGALPREANGGAPEPDGIIAPYGAISCLRLLRTSPTEALSDNPAFRALRNFYDTRGATLWGPFGPKESFNDAGQVADIYVGIDTGLEAMAIEDYRSGITETWFTSAPPIADALAVVYHKGLAPGDLDLSGAVTPADAAIALRIAGGLAPASPAQHYNGDLNGDGQVTLEDAVGMLR